jgi:hypothetical protein
LTCIDLHSCLNGALVTSVWRWSNTSSNHNVYLSILYFGLFLLTDNSMYNDLNNGLITDCAMNTAKHVLSYGLLSQPHWQALPQR